MAMGRQSKWEYFRTVFVRYRRADRETKQKMLDEFCANTGYHRKHALRPLNGPPPSECGGSSYRTPRCLRHRHFHGSGESRSGTPKPVT